MSGVLPFDTDLGPMFLAWEGGALRACRFGRISAQGEPPAWVRAAAEDLAHHLGGEPRNLAALPLELSALTPFQRRVAEVLRATHPGDTLTYGDVAFRLGQPGAARAVGRAVAANPLLVLIPCHRVVAATGPGGWSAFGAPEVKARLLALESGDTG